MHQYRFHKDYYNMESTITSKLAPRHLFSLSHFLSKYSSSYKHMSEIIRVQRKTKDLPKLPPLFLAPPALQCRYYPGQMSNQLKIIKCF